MLCTIAAFFLSCLRVINCPNLTDEGLKAIGKYGHNLSFLEIGKHCYGITGAGLSALAEGCPNLGQIVLHSIENVIDGLIAIGENCRKLKHLTLHNIYKDMDTAFSKIADGCPDFYDLELDSCFVTPEALRVICPKLTKLVLTNCHVTDEHLRAIAETGSGLKKLSVEFISYRDGVNSNVKGMDEITDEGLKFLSEGCANLERVKLQSCSMVTASGVNALAKVTSKPYGELSIVGCESVDQKKVAPKDKVLMDGGYIL